MVGGRNKIETREREIDKDRERNDCEKLTEKKNDGKRIRNMERGEKCKQRESDVFRVIAR